MSNLVLPALIKPPSAGTAVIESAEAQDVGRVDPSGTFTLTSITDRLICVFVTNEEWTNTQWTTGLSIPGFAFTEHLPARASYDRLGSYYKNQLYYLANDSEVGAIEFSALLTNSDSTQFCVNQISGADLVSPFGAIAIHEADAVADVSSWDITPTTANALALVGIAAHRGPLTALPDTTEGDVAWSGSTAYGWTGSRVCGAIGPHTVGIEHGSASQGAAGCAIEILAA